MGSADTGWGKSRGANEVSRDREAWKNPANQRAWFTYQGKDIILLTNAFEEVQRDGMTVTEMKVKPDRDGRGYLVTIKGVFEGQKIIAFHGGPSVHEALAECGSKLKKGAMKWRDDDLDRWLIERGLKPNGIASESD